MAQLDERLSVAKGTSATEGLSYITRMLPPGDTDMINNYVLLTPAVVRAYIFPRRGLSVIFIFICVCVCVCVCVFV